MNYNQNINCSYCSKSISQIKSRVQKYKLHYCNRECQKKNYKIILVGKNNPNYQKSWPKERKEALSLLKTNHKIKECVDCKTKIKVYPSRPKHKRCQSCYLNKLKTFVNKINIDSKILKNLFYEGLTDKEMGGYFGCSESVISNRRKSLNLRKIGTFNFKEKQNLTLLGIADDLRSMGCLKVVARNGLKHETCKWVVCWILAKRGYNFITETKVPGGVIDVYDLANKNIYELESNLYPKKEKEKFKQLFNEEKMNDFFIFNLKDVPDGFQEIIEYFDKEIV